MSSLAQFRDKEAARRSHWLTDGIDGRLLYILIFPMASTLSAYSAFSTPSTGAPSTGGGGRTDRAARRPSLSFMELRRAIRQD